jgi:hypothetical protein
MRCQPSGWTARAGSATIIGKDTELHELAKHEMGHIQVTNISIEDSEINVTISTIYCPPRHTIKMELYSAITNSLRHRLLVGGDLNAKHQ